MTIKYGPWHWITPVRTSNSELRSLKSSYLKWIRELNSMFWIWMHISCNILQRVEIIITFIRHAFHVMILFILYLPQHYIIYFDILRGGTVQDYRVSCYDSLIVKETLPGIINRVIFEISCFLKGQNIRKNSLTIQVCWFYMLIQTVTINSNCYVPKCQNKDFINSRFRSESTKIS